MSERPTRERIEEIRSKLKENADVPCERYSAFDREYVADLLREIDALAAELDEARDWVRRMHRETQTLTCVYCGKEYPPGTESSGSDALTRHISECPKHPLAAALADARLLAAEVRAWRKADDALGLPWEACDERYPPIIVARDAARAATDASGALSRCRPSPAPQAEVPGERV